MNTPKHLDGLTGVLTAVEEACAGTGFVWYLSKEPGSHGYFAQIISEAGAAGGSYMHHARSPTAALANALAEFNLRTKRSKP